MFTPSPALNKYNAIQQGLAPTDPISAGAEKGIQSAKTSLSMTPPRLKRTSALGRGIAAFAANRGVPQPGTGFAGNLDSMARAFAPAVNAYQDAQDRDAAYEVELWKMQHEQRAAEEDRRVRERQVQEMERHNQSIEGIQRGIHGLDSGATGNGPASLLEQFSPITDKRSLSNLFAKKNANATLLHEGNKIKLALADLERDKVGTDPFNPIPGSLAVKDFLATRLGNESTSKERLARKNLDALVGKFNQSVEKAIKGGVLSGQMIKYAEEKGLFPDREHDTLEEYKAKLEGVMSELATEYESANLSYKYRRAIDPLDLEKIKAMQTMEGGDNAHAGAALQPEQGDAKARLLMEAKKRGLVK